MGVPGGCPFRRELEFHEDREVKPVLNFLQLGLPQSDGSATLPC